MNGAAPLGSYQSSQTVDAKFVTEEEDLQSEEQPKNTMLFLKNLLKANLQHSYDSRRRPDPHPIPKRKNAETRRITGDESDNEESPSRSEPTGDDDLTEAERVECVAYVPEIDATRADVHCLRMVSLHSSTERFNYLVLTSGTTVNRSR